MLGSFEETVRKFFFFVLLKGCIKCSCRFLVHRICLRQVSFKLFWDLVDAHIYVPEVLGAFVLSHIQAGVVATNLNAVHVRNRKCILFISRILLLLSWLAVYQSVSSKRASKESFFCKVC